MTMSPRGSDTKGIDATALLHELNTRYAEYDRSGFKLTECKSNDKAIGYRLDGNNSFKETMYSAALTSYTRSIAWAVSGSEELALAFGNRSAVLFRISKYQACLFDVNRALQGKYPEDKRQKLLDRKEQCLMKVNKSESSSKRGKAAASATGPTHVRNDTEDEVNQWRKKCKFGNPLIPRASPKVKLAYSKKWGRHMVATENIDPGEILSSQKFFILTPENVYENCSFCLTKCAALIPCTSCSEMMYCSEYCLKQAYDMYHKIECKLMAFEGMSTADLKFQPLRMLLSGTQQGADLRNLMRKLTMQDIFAEEVDFSKKPFKNNYLSALNLCKNYDPLFVGGNLSLAVESTIMLEKTEFFESGSDSETGMLKVEYDLLSRFYVMMFLINHSMGRRNNAFTVTSMRDWIETLAKVGTGICTLHTFINHSCNPNVRWLIRDREHIIVAKRPIGKLDQIFTSYSDVFSHCPLEERIVELYRSHRFICECEACINRWPVYATWTAPMIQFKAENPKQAIEDFKKILSPILDGNIKSLKDDVILQIICDACKWIYANTNEPALSYAAECEECVWKFTTIVFDDPSREYAAGLKPFVEVILRAVMKCILDSYYSRGLLGAISSLRRS